MVYFSRNIKTCCLYVIWEKQYQIWAKMFFTPSRTPIFVVVNKSSVLTTQYQQWGDCAFCTLSLKRHAHSFPTAENNSIQFCISLSHIQYTLQPTYTSANIKWY